MKYARWLILVLWFSAAHAQESAKLLIASERMGGGYARTVIAVASIGDGREHLGIILNRPSDMTMGQLFPDSKPAANVIDKVFHGGPYHFDRVVMTVRSKPAEPSLELAPGIYFVAHVAAIDAQLEKDPNAARYYAGFVVWKPGELAQETKQGMWHVLPPRPDVMFRGETAGLWAELIALAKQPRARSDWPQHVVPETVPIGIRG